ncbi:hypothetical protein DPMN_083861 [Dreissena polymorpha]|uniref:Uncharacterized protein n=1 Tax=Dreissena polymorpha TaxID=45954 RepID=A0A9D4BBI6_DREPO|nr:hypothetical protein DPMN_083861 [Dreissena polymorpha]
MLTKPLREVAVRRPEEKRDGKCERVDVPSMDELLMAAHKKPDWRWISVTSFLISPLTTRPVKGVMIELEPFKELGPAPWRPCFSIVNYHF